MYQKRYLPHELKTRIYAVETYRKNGDIEYTCRKYHISRTSLWRWNNRYDGTKESLIDKSHKPKSRHPNSHTDKELYFIKNYIKRNPDITLNELWYKLSHYKGYRRSPSSLFRVCRKLGFYKKQVIKGTSKKHDKKYDTPTELGVKWQIDVKYVPVVCKASFLPDDMNFYQYTCIDEASRERYLYWYNEFCPANTVDFVKRCMNYFGYKPKEIQTDNGIEFTYNNANVSKIHPLDLFCSYNDIFHHTIRPRTPQHNGKVERSHRNDNERFYTYLKFYSLEDLRKQGARYLYRSNNIPMSVLNYLTPREMRKKMSA